MAETAFHTGDENADRLAEPFPADPWTGEKVQLFNMLEKPVMESGGGGLVSTTMDYARFARCCSMAAYSTAPDHRPQDAAN